MNGSYRCPACDAERNHPGAYCDQCDYCPDPVADLAEPLGANPPALGARNEAAGLLLSAALGALLALWLVTDVRDVDRAIIQLHAQLAALATL